MLRLLSIRNFVVVDELELEFEPGFSVLTGETGAGKSILLDALALLLGDRFELRQLKPGAERAELAASFELRDAAAALAWLEDQGLADDDAVLVRRTLDAQGRSRAWINGRPASLAQLAGLGAYLVDLHGQHAHQSLLAADSQRDLLDGFAGHEALALDTAEAWRTWRAAADRSAVGEREAASSAAERDLLAHRQRELAALAVTAEEWTELGRQQTRLAHGASLLEVTSAACDALADGDEALIDRLATILSRVAAVAAHDSALAEIVEAFKPARAELEEAIRALRSYRQRLDIDPNELSRVEERLAAIHDTARKYRVRPEVLPELLADTEARLRTLEAASDVETLARAAREAEASYRRLAMELGAARRGAAETLATRVSAAMQELAMAGGRLDIAVVPLEQPASYGLESIEFRVATHPKQAVAPLARVASGGELSRIALAIQVVTSEVANVPTLIFDEVDVGIGGTVAATVGRLLQSLGERRQVLCVTHLPQVAAFADAHFRVVKHGDAARVSTAVARLPAGERVEELARMLAGSAITAKTRAHARELLAQHRRSAG